MTEGEPVLDSGRLVELQTVKQPALVFGTMCRQHPPDRPILSRSHHRQEDFQKRVGWLSAFTAPVCSRS